MDDTIVTRDVIRAQVHSVEVQLSTVLFTLMQAPNSPVEPAQAQTLIDSLEGEFLDLTTMLRSWLSVNASERVAGR